MTHRVVYTALFGDYETLNDAQMRPEGVDFVCFTDDASLQSDVWRIELVAPEFAWDPHRSQRRLKILGHPLLLMYDESLYIDNSVSLTGDARELMATWLATADIAFARHSFRTTLADEFAAVMTHSLDDHHRVSEQWDHYVGTYSHVLDGQVLWGGMIARRPHHDVDALVATWFHHVLRYSRRDQLSLPVAIASHAARVHVATMDNHESPWHAWPIALARRANMRQTRNAIHVPRALEARVAAFELADRMTDLESQLAEEKASSAEVARAAEVRVAQELASSAAAARAAEVRVAEVLRSTSWRVTAPLRAARSLMSKVTRGA